MMKVLQRRSEIHDSRKRLESINASSLESKLHQILRRLGLNKGVPIGDWLKSWDVNLTIEFIRENLKKDQAILDIGAYASEMTVALHKLGFTNLAGVDLNPELKKMPFNQDIRFEISDFLATPFADASYDAVTSISVIEHGFDGNKLLSEVSRILKPGGYFLASFDYWPDKIETDGIKFFDMDWLIFSKADILELIALGKDYGLKPVGELAFDSGDKPINCANKDYTFGWIALQKSTS